MDKKNVNQIKPKDLFSNLLILSIYKPLSPLYYHLSYQFHLRRLYQYVEI